MAEAVGALRVDLRGNSAEFAADMGKARAAVATTGAAIRRTMDGMRKSASGFAGEIFSMRTAVMGFATGAAVSFLKRMADTADEIGNTARVIGITTDQLQEYRHVADIVGVSQEDLTGSLEIFTKQLGQAKQGAGSAQGALQQLGIGLDDVRRMSPAQALDAVLEKLRAIQDPLQRNALLTELFGRGGLSMAAMLSVSGKAVADLREEAHRLGLVLSEEDLDKAAKVGDEFDKLGSVARVAGVKIAAQFLPALEKVVELTTSPEFQQGLRDTAGALGDMVSWMVDHIDVVERFANAFIGMRLGGFAGAAFGKKGRIGGAVIGAIGGAYAKEIGGMLGLGGAGPEGGGAPRGPLHVNVTAGTVNPMESRFGSAGGFDYGGKEGASNLQDALNEKAKKYVDDLTNAMDALRSSADDALATFVDDLRKGKSLAESLADVMDGVLQTVIKMAEQDAVAALLGGQGTAGGGILGGLIGSAIGGAKNLIPSFADGGIMPHDGLAYVHAGEHILNKEQQGQGIVVHVEASPYFDARVAHVSGPIAARTSAAMLGKAAGSQARRQVTAGG